MDVSNGVSPLFVSHFGRGRPLLCLHSIEAHGLRYQQIAARLQADHPDELAAMISAYLDQVA